MGLGAAIRWFFKILREGEPAPAAASAPAAPPPVFMPSKEPALQLLALFQKEGRLLDFLMEDISAYSDAEIGAAARELHAGCRKALLERAAPEPVLSESEGAEVTLPEGFDASAIRVMGEVSGRAPFRGVVRHRGWRVRELRLPTVPPGADPAVIAPAEVELT